jgi:hypothetical protein
MQLGEVRVMDNKNGSGIREGLALIVEQFEGERRRLGTVKFYELIALKLSEMVRKSEPWTWRYVQGVHTGSLGASKLFGAAVQALGAALDGAPSGAAWTEAVSVFSPPGMVREGSVVLMASKPCRGPGCRMWIVGRVAYCSTECRRRAHNLRRRKGR